MSYQSAYIRDAIEAANASFMALYAAGELDGVARLYTEDAKVLNLGAHNVTGAWLALPKTGPASALHVNRSGCGGAPSPRLDILQLEARPAFKLARA